MFLKPAAAITKTKQ